MSLKDAIDVDGVLAYNAKWELTVMVSEAPAVKTDWGYFIPRKIVMKNYGDRVRIEVTGQASNGGAARTAAFFLGGYATFKPPPEWVMKVLSAAGFDPEKVS